MSPAYSARCTTSKTRARDGHVREKKNNASCFERKHSCGIPCSPFANPFSVTVAVYRCEASGLLWKRAASKVDGRIAKPRNVGTSEGAEVRAAGRQRDRRGSVISGQVPLPGDHGRSSAWTSIRYVRARTCAPFPTLPPDAWPKRHSFFPPKVTLTQGHRPSPAPPKPPPKESRVRNTLRFPS
ncbi:hypothetical protein MRX96_058620 [Rhipicephalus microplus]